MMSEQVQSTLSYEIADPSKNELIRDLQFIIKIPALLNLRAEIC